MGQPQPKTTTVCTECGEDWKRHVRLAAYRLAEEEGDREHLTPLADLMARAIPTHEDCIAMLKVRNQGPTGPVGPMGQSAWPQKA